VVPPLASVTRPTASSLTCAAAGRAATTPDASARNANDDDTVFDGLSRFELIRSRAMVGAAGERVVTVA
jgi:hypothetical protein